MAKRCSVLITVHSGISTPTNGVSMATTIRRAIIPAAGLGSRLLPLTKATPKEMLPVGDKPVIEHTVRELVASGITDITIVVSDGKTLIQDHFRPNPTLVDRLRAEGKTAYADAVEEVGELSQLGHITYLDQHGPYGNGTRSSTQRGTSTMSPCWSCGPTTSLWQRFHAHSN